MNAKATRLLDVLLPLALLATAPGQILAAVPANLVRAELVSDVSAIAPGQPFTIGLVLHVEPNWHVYWSNPGETGIPTTLKLTLPEGYSASDIRYPVPDRFLMPGDIVAYGYEKEVLLTATITPPKDAAEGQAVAITGQARWLVCSDVCVAGKVPLELKLPIATAAAPANPSTQELFRSWSSRFPVEPDAAHAKVSAVAPQPAEGEEGSQGAKKLGIQIQWSKDAAASDVEFFPGALDGLKVTNIAVHTKSATTTITLDARIFKGQTVAATALSGVVAYHDAAGQRVGMNVSIPIDALLPAKP
jgi:thiol:disulfide interchange protein DsbD